MTMDRRAVARRQLSIGLAAGVALLPLRAIPQPVARVWRVGFLALRRPESLDSDQFGAFVRGMRELGYVEGRNLVTEWRFADGVSARLPELAAELVGAKVDVVLAAGTQAIDAARKATTVIPIVMAGANDPVGSGFVASLARPGGNVTGLALRLEDVTPKQLELLRSILPRLAHVALLVNPANAATPVLRTNVEAAARRIGLAHLTVEARTGVDIDAAFAVAVRENAGGVIVASDALFTQHVHEIARLALRHRLPLVGPFRQYAEAGALLSYGQDFHDHFRRASSYVDRVLKGAKPGDLPVEQPDKFETVVNLRTARALGLALPAGLRVDEVLER